MDFNDTAEEGLFRAEARDFLNAHAQLKNDSEPRDESEAEYLARAKGWQKLKYENGWACLNWPKEYGGRDATPMQQIIWNQEESRYDVPTAPFAIGLGMCGPTMIAYASEQQKRDMLPRMASGENIWCQLFSEPAGGSDLAALRTKAERVGDEWIINGQKIWTSGAHYSRLGHPRDALGSDRGEAQGPHVLFPEHAVRPASTVKPIKQMSGDSNFNEVYFIDVRIPDAQRLGAVGQGWQVSLTTLMNERLAVGNAGGADFEDALALASGQARRRPAIRNQARTRKTGRLVLPVERSSLHELSRDQRVVARCNTGAGKLDHQGGQREEATGHWFVRHGSDGHGRHPDGSEAGTGRPRVPTELHGRAGIPHCGRHRRDSAEHHRRARAGPPARYPRRQECPVQ